MITIVCKQCGKEKEVRLGEYNRQKRNGREHFFCGLSCSATYRNTHRLVSEETKKKWVSHLPVGSSTDEFSPFRGFIKKCKQRKNRDFNLDLEYLKKLWEDQNGICPYTNLKMILPRCTCDNVHSLFMASIDRIDSSKGYIKGNVQFTTYFANVGKMEFSDEEAREFFRLVKESK